MYSPRSVSTDSRPWCSSRSLRSTSSVVMDFDLTMRCACRSRASAEDEVGDLGAVLAVDHLAAARFDVALELLQVVIEVLDGVLLEGVGLGAELLVIRQHLRRHGFGALIFQPSGGGVDGKLQAGVGQGGVNFLSRIRRTWLISGSPGPRPGAWCGSPTRPARGRPESASGSSDRAIPRCARRCVRMASILVRAMAPDSSANLTEKVPPKPQHSSAGCISRSSRPRTLARRRRGALADPELAQGVAAVVEGHHVLEAGAHVFHAGHFGQKGGELPNPPL